MSNGAMQKFSITLFLMKINGLLTTIVDAVDAANKFNIFNIKFDGYLSEINTSFFQNSGQYASRLLRRTGALLLATHCAMGWADAAADQRERALLNRALQEARPSPAENAASLPGASIPVPAKQEATAPRRRVLEEKQWRSLLSGQQMHRFGPESQAGAQSQWRAQNLERERRAEDLSADILQRSRSYLSNDRR